MSTSTGRAQIAEIIKAFNGKRRRVYRRWAIPFEIFSQLSACENYLWPSMTVEKLQQIAMTQSDTEAAVEMQGAKKQLLASSPDAALSAIRCRGPLQC